eukprot:CAMPEP_0194485072 /NCGR_PEP_ID=MMETSP0253-20130528/6191_1 /TAXON_ID=2966 /ORGANISM="Noctiluca scintillans" /LENGTH=138 /DNA_ID=CAMNT_0039324993 /DNA_START=53 /DNA_END=466 /DNA_ORIENTATION=-
MKALLTFIFLTPSFPGLHLSQMRAKLAQTPIELDEEMVALQQEVSMSVGDPLTRAVALTEEVSASNVTSATEQALTLAVATPSSALTGAASSKNKFILVLLELLGLGALGIDRMYMGQRLDIILGIVKLVTCGGCGVW